MSENENKVVEQEVQTAAENKSSGKKSVGKRVLKIVLWVLIAIMAILLLVLWQIDRVAATATRQVGSMITGTRVDVKSIYIRPLAGLVKVNGFTVGTPEGFHNPTAIGVGKFHVKVDVGSVLTNKIVVEHLELADVAIDMELTLSQGSNLDALLKNVEKNTGADQNAPEGDDDQENAGSPQKQVIIRKLILKDSRVTVSSGTLKTTMTIPLLPIEMEDVGEGSDLAGTVKEVLLRIITEIGKVVNFDAIGKGIVSGADAVVDGAGAVGKGLVRGADSVVDGAGAVGKGLVRGADAVVDGTGKVVDGAVGGTVNFLKKLPSLGK